MVHHSQHNMNKEINILAKEANIAITEELKDFYRLVGKKCASMCGSQLDQKTIQQHFGLDYLDGPTHHQDLRYQETQYSWSKHYFKEEPK